MAEKAVEAEAEPEAGEDVHAGGQPKVEPADAVIPEDRHGENHGDQREDDQEGSADQLHLGGPERRDGRCDRHDVWGHNGHSSSDR